MSDIGEDNPKPSTVDQGQSVERVKRSIRERNVSDTYRDEGVVYAVQLSVVAPDMAMCSINWNAGRNTRVRAKYLRVLE